MATDIKTENTESLRKQVVDLQENLRVARFEGAGSRSRNVRAIRETRREIARVLTEIHARHLKAALSVGEATIASEAKTA